jgi:simple sugar transport system substrate-binding protein
MKRTIRRTSILAVSLIGVSSLVGAAIPPANAAQKITIAVITHDDGGSFWTVAKKGAMAAGSAMRVNVKWEPAGLDVRKQAQLIDAAVTQKVSGIATSVPDAGVLRAPIARAIAAGIPVITLNSGASDFVSLGAITHVGQDETVAGAGAGAKLKAAGAKSLLCVIHEQGNQGLEDRCVGAKSTFGGTIVNLYVKGHSDPTTTINQISAKLSSDKSIDAVLTLDPDISANAITAVKQSGSKAIIATFDMSAKVIAAIKSGAILFAVDQQQYLQGYLSVVFLTLDIRNLNTVGGGLPVLTGPGFVTKANVDQVTALAKAGTR